MVEESTVQESMLQPWRQRLIRSILYATIVLAGLAMIVNAYNDYMNRLSWTILLYLGIYAVLLIIVLWRKAPYFIQTGTILFILYGMGVFNLAVHGLIRDGGVFFLAFSAFTVLFLGRKEGILALAVSALAIVAFGQAYSNHLLVVTPDILAVWNTSIHSWLGAAGVYLMLGGVLVLSLDFALRNIITSLSRSQELAAELEADIINRKRAEEEIRRSGERYRSILESMEEAYYEVDLHGNFTFFNTTAVSKLGYTNDEMMGMNFQRFVDKENVRKAFENYNHVFLSGETIKGFDWQIINNNGQKIDVEASVTLRRDDSGNAIGFKGVVRDITQRKRDEEALKASEEKYRTILEIIEEAYFELDLNGNYTFFNDSLCRTTGYSREELTGMNYTAYTSEETARLVSRDFKEIYNTGRPGTISYYEIIKKDGTKIIIEMSVALMRGASGKTSGFRGVGRDITKRIMAEKAVKESADRYRTIFENAATADIIVAEDTTILLANSNFEKMTGYAKEEIEGKMSWTSFLEGEDLERLKHYSEIRNVNPSQAPRSYEYRFTNRKGEIRDLVMNVAVFPETKESVASIIDITEKKIMEEQLLRAQKLEAVGTLAGGVAHDFNNLLMGILGNVSLIRMSFDESHPYYIRLKSVEDYVNRGSDLTKQLLGFARGGKYEVKSTDLGDFVRESSEMFGRTKKEIRIHNKAQDGLWGVEVDRGQMEQVLLNLYVNAWQAMQGGGDLYLSLENTRLNETDVSMYDINPGRFVKVTVTDTGIGMDEATKARIFEPFFTTKERGHGTGLGLASAYGIIKNHGGFIHVESEKDLGTSFILYLPASDKEVEGEFGSKDEIEMGCETVLLIDDEDMILDVGSQMLEGLGYKVMTASGGRQGLKIYEQYLDKIDLVILDMIMPDFNGGDTFETLRRVNPCVNVLLSSGYSLDGQAEEIMQSGCKGFIQKPFSIVELSKKIRGILGGQQVLNDDPLPVS